MVKKKSDPACVPVTRPLFNTDYDSSDAAVWRTWNLDRMYFKYGHLKIQRILLHFFSMKGE